MSVWQIRFYLSEPAAHLRTNMTVATEVAIVVDYSPPGLQPWTTTNLSTFMALNGISPLVKLQNMYVDLRMSPEPEST